MYAERKPPEEPPCFTCKVECLEENADAIRMFFLVRYQLIISAGGAVDVSHEAIHRAMGLYGIEKRRECFEKMLILSRWWIERVNKKEGE